MKKYWILSLGIALIITSCQNNNNVEPNEKNNYEKTSETTDDSQEYRALTLPTPMQMATLFKSYEFKYDPSLYTPIHEKIYTSKYQRAMAAGFYSTDLGYAIANNSGNNAAKYYKYLLDVYQQLGFSRSSDFVLQQKNQETKSDSIKSKFLELYNEMHKEILDYEQEEVGFYLLSGCFLESMCLYIHHYKNQNNPSRAKIFNTALSQQVVFLDNLLEINDHINKTEEESKQLTNILIQIAEKMEAFPVVWTDEKLYIETMPTTEYLQSIDDIITNYKSSIVEK
ncbi:MAG: hypothetical protein JXR60_08375 [Bacteroidales bacterium]|nr:hypothetical protein [Bacteroidales bacterium]